jgi:hypothetical protein
MRLPKTICCRKDNLSLAPLLKVLAQTNPNSIHNCITEIQLGEADKKGLNEVVSD